ncbi:MAG TPA: hypothetical protein VFG86_20880, partial [Chloroflexota bacterium]|nr:hypothetical protein [Chloroflexota bacterium]
NSSANDGDVEQATCPLIARVSTILIAKKRQCNRLLRAAEAFEPVGEGRERHEKRDPDYECDGRVPSPLPVVHIAARLARDGERPVSGVNACTSRHIAGPRRFSWHVRCP